MPSAVRHNGCIGDIQCVTAALTDFSIKAVRQGPLTEPREAQEKLTFRTTSTLWAGSTHAWGAGNSKNFQKKARNTLTPFGESVII